MKLPNSILLTVIIITIAFSQQYIPQNKQLVPLQDRYGNNLKLDVDPLTGSTGHVYGQLPNIGIYGFQPKDLSRTSIEQLSEKIFHDYADILKIDPAQTKLRSAETNGQWWFVAYKQTVNDVPVYGSEIGYTLNQKGNFIALGAHAYQNISISTTPKIVKSDAEATAKQAFAFDSVATEEGCDLVIFPKEENGGTTYYLTWEITLSRMNPLQNNVYFVNAQKGTIIDQKSNIMNSQISGTVTGSYWPIRNTDQTVSSGYLTTNIQVLNLQGQVVASVNSNSNGYYQTANNLSMQTYIVKFTLQNGNAQSQNSGGTPFTSTLQCLPGSGKNLNWGATDQTNVRWFASLQHDYFKNTFNYSAMDYQMGGLVGMGAGTNGAADGTKIFFGSDGGQQWARSSGVVFHEYTHNTVYHIYGGWIGGGGNDCCSEGASMDEGFADYFACSRINNPQQGVDCGVNRTLYNNYSWDPNQDKYFNCQVIGGACWDVRRYDGQAVSDNLVFTALQMVPHANSFCLFELNVLWADANYNNAHLNDIITAFSNHGMYCY